MPIRTLPNNLEAEESVLGSCFLSKYALQKANENLTSDSFYNEKNSKIFETMVALMDENTPIDITTVTSYLKKKNELNAVGGVEYLTEVLNYVPTASNIDYYIKSVEEALIVVPQSLQDASLSLGATKAQTILKVVLPCCINGILTGVLLSIGRVIGESAALIYTMGTFISDNPTINGSATSLSLMIWSFMSSEQPNFELACAISIIILAIVLVLNIIVKIMKILYLKEKFSLLL